MGRQGSLAFSLPFGETVFKSALAAVCKGHEELAASAIPLETWLPAVPARGGEPMVHRLFDPLGYAVEVDELAVDPSFPEWGAGRHIALSLHTVVHRRTKR